MEGVRVEKFVPFTSSLHSVAFINIKFHLPGEFPLGYRIKVSLQKGGIRFGFDAAVEDAIISKETDCTIDDFVREVIVVVVVCFDDLKFCLSSHLKAASCAWCISEMPPSKQVNGHSFTICLIVWCPPQSQSGEAM